MSHFIVGKNYACLNFCIIMEGTQLIEFVYDGELIRVYRTKRSISYKSLFIFIWPANNV